MDQTLASNTVVVSVVMVNSDGSSKTITMNPRASSLQAAYHSLPFDESEVASVILACTSCGEVLIVKSRGGVLVDGPAHQAVCTGRKLIGESGIIINPDF